MTVRTRTTIMNQDENMKDGKYEETLERAKELHEAGNALTKAKMEIVFPELKESDDERIREGLIQHLKELRSWKVGTGAPIKVAAHYDAWIAYLERQKEQKPAEWSEEDEFFRQQLIVYCENCVQDTLAAKCVNWLKSLRPQQKEEVVDRNVFYRIADILRWCNLPIGCPVENFKESESEREHLLEIVQCVAHRYANSCTYCKEYSRGYQDGLAVPHWKPSEEQMNHLLYAYTQLKLQKCYAPHVYETLGSLYDDLKKLI